MVGWIKTGPNKFSNQNFVRQRPPTKTSKHLLDKSVLYISLWARVVAKILATNHGYNRFNIRTIPTVASMVCIEKPTYFSKKRERERKIRKRGEAKRHRQQNSSRRINVGRWNPHHTPIVEQNTLAYFAFDDRVGYSLAASEAPSPPSPLPPPPSS